MSLTSDLLIYNFFVVFSSFSPVFAYLISRMKFLDGNRRGYFLFISSLLLFIVILLLFYPATYMSQGVSKVATPVNALILYPFSIILSSLILKINFKKEYSKIIALSLLLGFLLTELHELPAFIQEYVNIGIANYHTYPYHYLSHIATATFFMLAIKIGELKIRKHHIILFLLVFGVTYSFYIIDPYLDYVLNPISGATTFSIYNYAKRFLWFGWLSYLFYDGSKKL